MTAHSLHAQREWLLEHFPADLGIVTGKVQPGARTSGKLEPGTLVSDSSYAPEGLARLWREWGRLDVTIHRASRCYRCGKLLAAKAIFPDKVDPNGTTRRSNLRPACREHVGMTPPRADEPVVATPPEVVETMHAAAEAARARRLHGRTSHDMAQSAGYLTPRAGQAVTIDTDG